MGPLKKMKGETIFRIQGMTCAACSGAVEEAISSLNGVDLVSVSLMTEEAKVWHDKNICTAPEIRQAIENCGFEADNGRMGTQERLIETKLSIQGMTCGSCSASITEALEKLPGVEMVAVSLVTETGLVKHSSSVLVDQVSETIENCGFEVTVVDSSAASLGNVNTVTSHFNVTGMTCASCSGSITNALEALPGVNAVVVSLLTNQAVVTHEGLLDTQQIIDTISDCGFEATLAGSSSTAEANEVEEVVLQIHGVNETTDLNAFRYNLEAFLQSNAGVISHKLALGSVDSDAMNHSSENSHTIQALHAPDTDHTQEEGILVDELSVTYLPSQVGIRDLVDGINSSFPELTFTVVNSVDQACAAQLKMLSRVKEIQYWKSNFIWSLSLGIPVMIFHHVQHLKPFNSALIFPGLYWVSLLQMVPSAYVQFVLGHTFIRKLIKCIRRKGGANMDVLVSLSTLISFFFSVFALFLSVWSGQTSRPPRLLFDTNVMLICFISLGKCLENRAKGATSTALSNLLELSPTTCVIVTDLAMYESWAASHAEESKTEEMIDFPTREIGIDLIQPNDIAVALPGSKIPADGIILYGSSEIDESIITGESIPVFKTKGDPVIGGSINGPHLIHIRVLKTGKKSQLQQIINLVRDSQTTKAPVQRLADRLASRFVPCVLALAFLTLMFWIITCYLGNESKLPKAFMKDENGKYFVCLKLAISVIVVACPCALGLAAPTAVMVGTGVGASHGALIKGGEVLENANKIGIILLDKTGTLTTGDMTVSKAVKEDESLSDVDYWKLVGTVEGSSEHPLGKAIMKYARLQAGLIFEEDSFDTVMSNFEVLTGMGVTADVKIAEKGKPYSIAIGNHRLLQSRYPEIELPSQENDHTSKAYVIIDGRLSGLISLTDSLRHNAKDVVNYLRYNLGIQVGIVTGDNKSSAYHIAKQLDLPQGNVFAEVLAINKDKVVASIKEKFQCGVAFVGDGINDAPALVKADIGMAISSGTDVAIDSADIVLLSTAGNTDQGIAGIPTALSISRSTLRKIKTNFGLSVVYNALMVPFAMGLFLPLNLMLPPIAAGGAMAMSSVSVVVSSLMLKRWKPPIIATDNTVQEDQLYGFTLQGSTSDDFKQLQRLGRTRRFGNGKFWGRRPNTNAYELVPTLF